MVLKMCCDCQLCVVLNLRIIQITSDVETWEKEKPSKGNTVWIGVNGRKMDRQTAGIAGIHTLHNAL